MSRRPSTGELKFHTYEIFEFVEISDVIVNYSQTIVLNVKCMQSTETKQRQWQLLQHVMTTQFTQSTLFLLHSMTYVKVQPSTKSNQTWLTPPKSDLTIQCNPNLSQKFRSVYYVSTIHSRKLNSTTLLLNSTTLLVEFSAVHWALHIYMHWPCSGVSTVVM